MAEYTIDKIEYGDNVYKLQDNVSGYVSGGNVIPYLTCGTAAGTAAKTTTLVTGTLPTTLTTGTRVAVKFTKSNTVANPTIAIGSYGAIAIKRYGTTAPSTTAATSWSEGNVITLVYDGTNWLMSDWTLSSASHTHGNISSGGDITATAPTIASGDQIIINDNSASKITNGPTFDGSTTTTALTPKGTWESFAKSDTNTTYELSGALSSHKFTSTLTAGGSGSGTTSSDFTLAAGTGITITDDTSNRKMTIACSVTNTDKRLEVSEATSGIFYYPILSTGTTVAETRSQDTTGFSFLGVSGTGTANGTATFTLGNNSTGGSGKYGKLTIYSASQYGATFQTGSAFTANRTFSLPDKSGTIALTSDLSNYMTLPSNTDYASYGWVLSYGNGWVPTSAFQISVMPNFDEHGDPDGTYYCWNYQLIRDVFFEGRTLELHIELLSSSNESVTHVLTDYYFREIPYPDESDNYQIIEFTGIIREIGVTQRKITCRIYLDENEGVHTNGEVTVDIREIGERYTINGGDTGYTTNINTSADQFKQLAVLNLPAGTWIVTARARFTPTSSSNHYSAINIGTTTAGSGSTTTGNAIRDRRYGEGTYFNQHALTRIISLATDMPVYLNGGGSNVAGTWNRTNEVFQFDAIRIS